MSVSVKVDDLVPYKIKMKWSEYGGDDRGWYWNEDVRVRCLGKVLLLSHNGLT